MLGTSALCSIKMATQLTCAHVIRIQTAKSVVVYSLSCQTVYYWYQNIEKHRLFAEGELRVDRQINGDNGGSRIY